MTVKIDGTLGIGEIPGLDLENGVAIDDTTGDMILKTGDVEKARLTQEGRLGIGVENPNAELHVSGDSIIDNGQSTTLTIKSDDSGSSQISLIGDNQGTGRVYVGQSLGFGGGIEYNGDNSPSTTGAGADYVTLYRRSGNTDVWTARNLVTDNNWEFRGDITVSGGDITLGGTGRIQGIDTVSASTDATNKAYVDNKFAQDAISQTDADARYVNVAGDTMTGALTVSSQVTASGGFASSKKNNQAFALQHNTTAPYYNTYTQTGSEYQAIIKGRVDHGDSKEDSVYSVGTLNAPNNSGNLLVAHYIKGDGTGSTVTYLMNESGNMSIAGDLVVNGGDITLGGTGRIQGIDTVSATTDATNKSYVDSQVNTRLTQSTADGRYVRKNVGFEWTGTGGNALSFRSNDTIDTSTGDQAALEVYQDTAGADAFMQFHVGGDYAKYFGLHGGINDFVIGGWSSGSQYQRLFHDGYHPNADKLTTARTISLTGDLSGSATFDGSSNITISAQVGNDSHTHDSRYYTKSQSDSRFLRDEPSRTILFSGSAGGGTINLSAAYTGFDYLEVYLGLDNGQSFSSHIVSVDSIEYARQLGKDYEFFIGTDVFWRFKPDTNRNRINTNNERGIIYRVIGIRY